MYELKERDTQTKVKHEILSEYLIKWGAIITNGLKGHYARNPNLRPQFKARFVYVDYFSFVGAYTENSEIVYGSPVLGVRALDEIKQFFITQTAGLAPTTTAILFEQDTTTFNNLLTTLKNLGYADRIKHLDEGNTVGDGDIVVVQGDSSQYVDRVLKFVDAINPTYSFHFIDPFGTKAVERRNIERIVSQKGADCIINMMLNTISRFMVSAVKEEQVPAEEAHAEYFDKFYGSDIWRRIAHDFEGDKFDRQEAEHRLVEAYEAVLHAADSDLTVKQIPLKFQDKEQTLYYLFLTTHDPTGACEMNVVLADAHIREYDYRVERRRTKAQPEQAAFDFLAQVPDQKRPSEPEPDIDLVAEQIYRACRSRVMTFREVLRAMCNSPYFQQDLREALGKLKADGRATFDSTPSRLTNSSEIKFP